MTEEEHRVASETRLRCGVFTRGNEVETGPKPVWSLVRDRER